MFLFVNFFFLNDVEREIIGNIIDDVEVRRVVFEMGGLKVFGVDGFFLFFIRKVGKLWGEIFVIW